MYSFIRLEEGRDPFKTDPQRGDAMQRLRSAWASPSLIRVFTWQSKVANGLNYLLVDRKDFVQTRWMPRLIRGFAGCTCYFVGFVVL